MYSVVSTQTKKQGASPQMQNTPRERLLQFSHILQTVLFDRLEFELGPLAEKARLLVAVLGMLPLSRWIAPQRGWQGRPSKDRQALGAAFLAKAIYGLETTRQLLERLRTDAQLRCLCGWNTVRQIPHDRRFRAPSPNSRKPNCRSAYTKH